MQCELWEYGNMDWEHWKKWKNQLLSLCIDPNEKLLVLTLRLCLFKIKLQNIIEMEKAKLFKEDEQLFAEMEGRYISENEKQFFEEMHYKQIYKPVGCVDVIMDESSNENHVYIDREGFGEYIIGRRYDGAHYQIHVMCLSEALNTNMADIGLEASITLLEWLRMRDYNNILYNSKDE